jgi:hypothetical protein
LAFWHKKCIGSDFKFLFPKEKLSVFIQCKFIHRKYLSSTKNGSAKKTITEEICEKQQQ